MSRQFATFPVENFDKIKRKVLAFGNTARTFCFLDNHDYNFSKSYECLAAIGAASSVIKQDNNVRIEDLDHFLTENGDWIFGHLSYDLKNEIEDLSSANPTNIHFPDYFFFVPSILVILSQEELTVGCLNDIPQTVFEAILGEDDRKIHRRTNTSLHKSISRREYLRRVEDIQKHIHLGDCYELNFCQEFFANDIPITPLECYLSLTEISPNPFAAFYKLGQRFLCCASPERYLKKVGEEIFSQPMKGTISRKVDDVNFDETLKKELAESEKEKAENTMIVDLVRNDLSKVCEEGTVRVKEHAAVYSFPHVHQMISTVEGKISPSVKFSDIVKATFPMGSMTGAPKRKVMQLIEKFESVKRGLFSGTVGYFTPEKDFDFNVVIRSIQFDVESKALSIMTGSAITAQSDPDKEYGECLVKASALAEAIGARLENY